MTKKAPNASRPGQPVSSRASVLGREEGIPWVWVTGGALVTILFMIVGLLGYIFSMGVTALWPKDILVIRSDAVGSASEAQSPAVVVGTFQRRLVQQNSMESATPEAEAGQAGGQPLLNIIYQANIDWHGREFAYVSDAEVRAASRPESLWYVERREWGPFIGDVKDLAPDAVAQAIEAAHARGAAIERFEHEYIRPINAERERIRLDMKRNLRGVAEGESVDPLEADSLAKRSEDLTQEYEKNAARLAAMREADAASTLTLVAFDGSEKVIPVSLIQRAFQPNRLGLVGKLRVYAARVWEFVSDNPREANTQGGVYPAIFGTVVMTLIMTLVVLPAGVMAAIYIREIASQGFLVSIVRIAVGNLAGVPSIVYGIFGLGFFCYGLGSQLDGLFFRDKLPSPTFGTGGVLWASLTLALLTLPVVIVSTEEALQAVPRSLREASYGCGATRLQTLLWVVIPRAMPGVMTGVILAMARGMGEVAPLLVTGVVKLAPQLPIDGDFPFFHLERSFMHLGFHIYDVGFQSRSAEVSRPMVFASTGLLVGLVFVLNLVAIRVRSRLRRRFEGRGAF